MDQPTPRRTETPAAADTAAGAPRGDVPARGAVTAPRPLTGAVRRLGDAGSATAEYAIATLAACGFAGLLLAVLTSSQVRGLLLGIIQRALSAA